MENENERNGLTVTLVTIASICFAFFGVPVGPLVDGGVLKILGRNKDQYGRQRMFGSISFGVAQCLVGFVADWTKDMNVIFYAYSIFSVCLITVAGSTQFRPERFELPGRMRIRSSLPRANQKHIALQPSASMATAHSSSSANNDNEAPSQRHKMKQFHIDYEAYDNDFIDNESSQIRENEIQRLIQFATESSIIEAVNLSNPPAYRRRSSYAAGAPSDEEIIRPMPTSLLELLNDLGASIAFSALWGAGVVQADELAPPPLQATSQGILAAMYAGVGAGLGSLIGGVIYDRFGVNQMFYAVIGLTSLSLELYLEANTRCGLSDMMRWIYRMAVRMHKWIQHARGIGRAVPRWSGGRRGRIRLEDD
ncbi:hypothetical protein EC973_003433 [Apophysomyces ossiformis]|uniref:Major facilitator superfamily associated domain-containing protein n=1 Tax=Apophysomyces ossiformis TaxID=679940 RepID=A0A8H7EN49_9FUNG|nr:hypothetical protein EC973_003433 [Apophysomyces ossiformis]